jgi:hypothetical protein
VLERVPSIVILCIAGLIGASLVISAHIQDGPAFPSQIPAGDVPSDPIALLQGRIDRGEVRLRYMPERGYLPSLLKELKIPASSQTLVFSKTSLQTDHISRAAPRAVYFNDEVYVGWIPGSPMMEIAAVDPKYGAMFYTIAQTEAKSPAFRRLEQPCTGCHGPVHAAVPAPLFLMMSTDTNELGDILNDFFLTTDRSPFSERWGGWYVTGSVGNAKHMGRAIPSDTKRYLTSHSDPVALMLLAHQADVHNRMSEAAQKLRLSKGEEGLPETLDPLVNVLTFSGEATFAAPVRGSSSFAKEFTAKGPKDRRGRSLRDFDLQRRLFRYPVSYLIYSEAFRQLSPAARAYVYGRLRAEPFPQLSEAERAATLEILAATLPEFQR